LQRQLSLSHIQNRKKEKRRKHTLSLSFPFSHRIHHFLIFLRGERIEKGGGGRGEGGGDLSPFILLFVAQILIETNALIDRPA